MDVIEIFLFFPLLDPHLLYVISLSFSTSTSVEVVFKVYFYCPLGPLSTPELHDFSSLAWTHCGDLLREGTFSPALRSSSFVSYPRHSGMTHCYTIFHKSKMWRAPKMTPCHGLHSYNNLTKSHFNYLSTVSLSAHLPTTFHHGNLLCHPRYGNGTPLKKNPSNSFQITW